MWRRKVGWFLWRIFHPREDEAREIYYEFCKPPVNPRCPTCGVCSEDIRSFGRWLEKRRCRWLRKKGKLREAVQILFGKPCEHQDIILSHVHTWAVFLAPDQMTVRCTSCPEVATTLRIMAWAEARRLGGLELWTQTFRSPEEVPRAQRIPGAFCLPLIAGTEKEFEGAYKGYSPTDLQAMKESRQDLYLDKLTLKATDEKQKQQDEELEKIKERHDVLLGRVVRSDKPLEAATKAELDRLLIEANEKDKD